VINFRDAHPAVYPAATFKPLYDKIEFCCDPETLWAKIESRWDWLGVHPQGQFIVGYPKREAMPEQPRPYGPIYAPGANGDHNVRCRPPIVKEWQDMWPLTEDDAKAKFEQIVRVQEGYAEARRPVLLRVQRLRHGEIADERLIATRPATYR
jgi:hypothetical protein